MCMNPAKQIRLFFAIFAAALPVLFNVSICNALDKEKTAQPPRSIVIGDTSPGKGLGGDISQILEYLDAALPKMKAAGATSNETYVRWFVIEPRKNEFFFSDFDRIAELYRKHDMKWVPFLIVGPTYSLPDWYYNSGNSQGYVCLEHNMGTPTQSLWNPDMRQHIDRVVKAFADHYGDGGLIESILLGVSGDYGEAIYPAGGNSATYALHGEYHTHQGFWAGDKYAVASFRNYLRKKYKDIEELNTAWKSDYKTYESIAPVLRAQASSDRAWYDFIVWYRESMNEYTEFWVATVRKYFPETPIYICTGGSAAPEHGSDFTAQTLIAKKYNAGIRITNEGSDYANNFTLTRWVASASRYYGVYFGFEPAGEVDKHGVVARIFNAAYSGAWQLHTYMPNIFESPEQKNLWDANIGLYNPREPLVDIAVFYSKPSRALGADFHASARELRDYFDYDIIDDTLVANGALDQYKMLIWASGATAEQKALDAITKWIHGGGVLLYYTGAGPVRTVDGTPLDWPGPLEGMINPSIIQNIDSISPANAERVKDKLVLNYGKGHILLITKTGNPNDIFSISPMRKIVKWLFSGKLGFGVDTREAIDPGDPDKIYFSLVSNGDRLVALSQGAKPVTKSVLINGTAVNVQTEPDKIVELDLK